MMKHTSGILFIFSVYLLLYSVQCGSIRAAGNETTTSFTGSMFPNPNSYKSINSSTIEVSWIPSPNIQDIDLTQLEGQITIALYAGAQLSTYSTLIVYPLTKLNESGTIVLNNLQADSIYNVYFQTVYQGNGTTIFMASTAAPRLIRTYMSDQTTLNPIPPFGQYTWKQVEKDSKITAVIFNTSFSSQLPFTNRSVSIQVGSMEINQTLSPTVDLTQLEFDLNITQTTTYPLTVTFTAVDNTVASYFRAGLTSSKTSTTITITPPTPSNNTANKQLHVNSLFLLFIILFILF